MAKIKVISDRPLIDGMTVAFRAPCDCNAVDGLTVTYLGVGEDFTFRDAHGNDLAGLGNLFSQNALVKAVLDVSNNSAYLQNAATNKYLENKIGTTVQIAKLWENENPTSEFKAQTVTLDLSGYDGVMIATKFQASVDNIATTGFIPIGTSGYVSVFNTRAARVRKFTVSTTGVEFEAGASMIDTTASGKASYAVPIAIYGIKGVTSQL